MFANVSERLIERQYSEWGTLDSVVNEFMEYLLSVNGQLKIVNESISKYSNSKEVYESIIELSNGSRYMIEINKILSWKCTAIRCIGR
ncbi:hypothetical protein P8891_06105 [Bacillus atrophaeus]|uniref:hypothetical protein n=1 Tax=Bacillus atrophaeus TaxID=1452 RepID=UPI00227F6388|nr:hypothetical protein [Bacillus atrophaeus]MCY7948048.1 hypothetical protein [Bacillus atrophaeus]MCY8098007.1 hypothetical protein [Bacillus atrophaeus]MCY9169931.1 hypothetical protein [Bacillus atrophaeus]MEC0740656.1 hypothetical protein [Bacillus atrophaeus]MEC0747080.1 hypothetical protein [Bacillus atrophaeus]